LIIAPEAEADLLDIFVYIAAENPRAAKRLIDILLAKMHWIAETGFTGQPRDELAFGLRSVVYRERCIFYRVDSEQVRVVRVLHGRRDLGRQSFSETDS
jgi:toxin ParE1/3/4